MPKKRGKSPSVDVMVRFFMRHYDIPTKDDINKILARIDHLETLLKSSGHNLEKRTSGKGGTKIPTSTASDTVLEVVRSFTDGASFAEIQARTGFEEKKLRNIVFRLSNTGKIRSKARGVYIAC